MNNTYYNNSIMSLEEEDSPNHLNPNKTKRKPNNKTKSNSSLFGSIINSVYKIGQGLKNIMSMKINIENEDESNPDLYNQISNRFNMNEEINLIDAPSFMEESFIKDNSNKKIESNIMMTSKNDINKEDINRNNKILDTIENFNNSLINQKEEIINTDILPNNERKLSIKSLLLNKKRKNENNIENILERNEEEEKNEEENINNNSSIKKNKLNNENILNKSMNSIKMNLSMSKDLNKSRRSRNINNTSMTNLSMMSLENIKKEINKRREENLRNVEEMQKRHGLNYDDAKEREMRDKILEEYYKDKAKRIAEGKLQMEREKKKREEEFKKLKIKKVSGLKYNSIQKKPAILSETKSTEIQFKPNKINFSEKIEKVKKEEFKQPIAKPEGKDISISTSFSFGTKIPEKNDKIKDIKTSSKIELLNEPPQASIEPPKIKLEEKPLFGFGINNKEDNNDKQNKANETKPSLGLFSNTLINNTQNQEKPENKGLSSLFGNNEDKNKEAESQKKLDNKNLPLISPMINTQKPEKENKDEQKTKNDVKQEDFFGSSTNLLNKGQDSVLSLFNHDNNNHTNIFRTQPTNEKGGLFDQNNSVSQGINNTSLFNSNKTTNIANGTSSLMNEKNPFLQSKTPSQKNLFGAPANNDNNQKPNNNQSLFGNTTSLFGVNTNKGLFG